MSNEFCLDCGMLLSPNTSLCAGCGFDNNYEDDIAMDIDQLIDMSEDFIPENYPGF